MDQGYAAAREYRRNCLKRKRAAKYQNIRGYVNNPSPLVPFNTFVENVILAQENDVPNFNSMPSDESEIYDPSLNSVNQFGSFIDHPQFLQSEIQGCLDIGDPEYNCSSCGASFWLLERTERESRADRPIFTLCCFKGKIQLPLLQRAPNLLYNLINGSNNKSLHFQKNIRSYNSMFAFTSFGGKVLSSINDGSGPPQFIITGQNYHRIESLLPNIGERPKFAQLYIYDTEHELIHRQGIFGYVSFIFKFYFIIVVNACVC
ncbi:hypothetical protein PIB30_118793 [Stylosanthes scabra]|uniref:ATP-dependent DNA helicase PIF1 n=1 Tax=Stylosanthes scabra TaxID=79078 RepID=A0ABU6Q8M9_9FABA|nr:hypothetical protein [Stylosanthes scabra]